MSSKTDFPHAVYTPQEAAAIAVQAVERVETQRTRGIGFPISPIDEYFAPLLPGQLAVVLAQTSNYKSSFMRFWERKAALQLMAEGRDDECIIHVSTEEVIEEQVFVELSRLSGDKIGDLARGEVQDWKQLQKAAIEVGKIPIYRIGDSLARPEDTPNLYLTNMLRAIEALISGQVMGRPIKPALMVFDYLQAFPIDPEVRTTEIQGQRRLQVRNDIYHLRRASVQFDCPVVVGVQAKQQLGGAPGTNMQIPGMYDGEESSSIAQRADRMLSLWMPARTHLIGEEIQHKDTRFEVTENLLWMRVLKQRGSLPAGKAWVCGIDHGKNEVYPMDLRTVSLND